jgi:hypothetical protein
VLITTNEKRIDQDNIIVIFGEKYLNKICNRKNINNWRGSVIRQNGKIIIPTFDLNILDKVNINRQLISFDIKKAIDIQRNDFKITAQKIIPYKNKEVVISFLNLYKEKKRVAFDIEVDIEKLKTICISFAFDKESALSVPFDYDSEIKQTIIEILENPDITKIGQNIIFDIDFIYKREGIKTVGKLEDTMIAQSLLMPEFSKGLAFITSIWTDIPYYKGDGKEWLDRTNRLYEYNALDSLACINAIDVQLAELKNKDLYHQYRKMADFLHIIIKMLDQGIPINYDLYLKELTEIKEVKNEVLNNILNTVGNKYNKKFPNSRKQIKEYFYGDLKIKPYISKKRPSVNEDKLRKIYEKHNRQEAKEILIYKKISKYLMKFSDILGTNKTKINFAFNPINFTTSKNIFGEGMRINNYDEFYVIYNSCVIPKKNERFINIIINDSIYDNSEKSKKAFKEIIKNSIINKGYAENYMARRIYINDDIYDFRIRNKIFEDCWDNIINSTVKDYILELIFRIDKYNLFNLIYLSQFNILYKILANKKVINNDMLINKIIMVSKGILNSYGLRLNFTIEIKELLDWDDSTTKIATFNNSGELTKEEISGWRQNDIYLTGLTRI